ncbi:MFS general substrate transporter [Cadophora sp. DSE1049]|nr:MFS general substrate transporter [Cadophora sp. DSE1049]
MAFGILESRAAYPPGTSLLELVHSTEVKIVLVPQPSDSRSDPLNWSKVRKEAFFLTIVFGTCATGVIGPVLVPGFSIVAADFGLTLTQVSLLNGSLVMGLGVSAYICAAIAPIYGNRLIYLLTTMLSIVSCVWAASAKSYGSLVGSRTVQGLAMGGFFGLAGTISINDVWFTHERGVRVGLWNMASIASINIAPIISGYVIVDMGWRWSFWLLAITYGIVLLAVVLFLPETAFDRSGRMLPDDLTFAISSNNNNDLATGTNDASGIAEEHIRANRRILGLGNFKIRAQSGVISRLTSPLLLLRAPATIWSCAQWSVVYSWMIISSLVAEQIFAAPPYNMNSIQVGIFIGCAPLVGAVLGTFISGVFSDYIVKLMSIRNNGIYEPEFRLVVMLPFVVIWCVGTYGLGAALENQMSKVVCGTFLAIIAFAVGVGCTGVVSYSNDVCRGRAAESFGITMIIKSAFAFGLTFMMNDYYANHGPMVFMATWASLTLGVTLTTIPLYVFGKRSRAWTHEQNIL